MKTAPVYLLAGPEFGKRAAFVGELRSALAAEDGQAPEEHRLYAQDTGPGELLALLRNGALFSSRRLVEYRGVELVKTKDDIAALAAYIAAPAPEAVLILVTDQFYAEKALEDAVGKANKRSFFEMFENEKPRWIENRLRRLGLSARPEAVEAMLELIENETGALDAACLQLACAFPKDSVLSEADIESSIARTRQEDAFSLFGRMVESGLEEALSTLEALLADRRGDAAQICSAILWSFRRLVKLQLCIEEGLGLEQACLKLQLRSKTAQKQNAAALRRYSRADCERIVCFASSLEGLVRSAGQAQERVLLHALVYGIMVRSGQLDMTPSCCEELR